MVLDKSEGMPCDCSGLRPVSLVVFVTSSVGGCVLPCMLANNSVRERGCSNRVLLRCVRYASHQAPQGAGETRPTWPHPRRPQPLCLAQPDLLISVCGSWAADGSALRPERRATRRRLTRTHGAVRSHVATWLAWAAAHPPPPPGVSPSLA